MTSKKQFFPQAAALVVSISVYLFFTVSALSTQWPDIFFLKGDQIHDGYKVDFYQIPNGFKQCMDGGPLGGHSNQPDIPNVYHPVFTIAIGLIFSPFSHESSYMFWVIMHAVVWISTGVYLFIRHKNNTHIGLSLLFFFGLFPHYLEIRNGQYHILLNSFITILLIYATSGYRKPITEGILYACSLLVKPIGLLWIFGYIYAKRWQTAAIGTILFGLLTLVFVVLTFIFHRDMGLYYVVNLLVHINITGSGIPQVFTLDALLRNWHIPWYDTHIAKILIGLSIIVWGYIKRASLFSQLFVWTSFYLLFYDLVFEYHYTTLAPFFAVGILTQKTFRKPYMIFLMATYLLPTPYVIMKALHIGITDETVTMFGWTLLVLWRTIPLIILSYITLTQPRGTTVKKLEAS